ncbi:MAG: hypothetical protein ABI232_09365 [Jatrophihabitantaceae bacterium]
MRQTARVRPGGQVRWGQRLEDSRVGQALITLVMGVLVVAIVCWNLPAGSAHDAVSPAAGPVVQALGLEQDWALFAPNPRGFSVGVYVTLTYADGHTRRIDPPHNGLVLSPYRTYRWQKYVERLRADDYSNLWEPTARYYARTYGPDVVEVVLTRTFQNVQVPGGSGPRPAAQHYDFYTLVLP